MRLNVQNVRDELRFLLDKVKRIRRLNYMPRENLEPMEDALEEVQVNLVAFEEAAKGAKSGGA